MYSSVPTSGGTDDGAWSLPKRKQKKPLSGFPTSIPTPASSAISDIRQGEISEISKNTAHTSSNDQPVSTEDTSTAGIKENSLIHCLTKDKFSPAVTDIQDDQRIPYSTCPHPVHTKYPAVTRCDSLPGTTRFRPTFRDSRISCPSIGGECAYSLTKAAVYSRSGIEATLNNLRCAENTFTEEDICRDLKASFKTTGNEKEAECSLVRWTAGTHDNQGKFHPYDLDGQEEFTIDSECLPATKLRWRKWIEDLKSLEKDNAAPPCDTSGSVASLSTAGKSDATSAGNENSAKPSASKPKAGFLQKRKKAKKNRGKIGDD